MYASPRDRTTDHPAAQPRDRGTLPRHIDCADDAADRRVDARPPRGGGNRDPEAWNRRTDRD